ncbi:MAG: RNA methyltransferase [Thermoleophilia bacterium]|nr:RNA methyltransferase [Thermoleophilia bacterium]
MIRTIAGRHNHSLRLARKLQKKKYRRERGLLVGEGLDVLRSAWEAGAKVREVLVREDLLPCLPDDLIEEAKREPHVSSLEPGESAETEGVDVGLVSAELLEWASSLGGGADVIFMAALPSASLADIPLGSALTLFLDKVGDPGNVGTLIRSAVAFGAMGVCCSSGTADPFSPKALRAGMGAQFCLPVVVDVSPADMIAKLQNMANRGEQVPIVWVAESRGGEDARVLPVSEGMILVLGDEREGPSQDWRGNQVVTVPQYQFDSLNVAMAGTVLLYEIARRRGLGERRSHFGHAEHS